MSCFSSSRAASTVKKPCSSSSSSSKVVMLDGTLRDFSQCTTAHNVATYGGDESDDCIVFNTEKLGVGKRISPLKPGDTLDPGRMYMLLPRSMSHRRLDSEGVESFLTKVKEAVLMADLEERFDHKRDLFCGLRGMLLSVSGHEIDGKIKREVDDDHDVKMRRSDESVDRVLDDEGKKVGKNEYVWYLGFAILPVEEDDDHE